VALELVLNHLNFPFRKYNTSETADANSLSHKFYEVSFQDWSQRPSPTMSHWDACCMYN